MTTIKNYSSIKAPRKIFIILHKHQNIYNRQRASLPKQSSPQLKRANPYIGFSSSYLYNKIIISLSRSNICWTNLSKNNKEKSFKAPSAYHWMKWGGGVLLWSWMCNSPIIWGQRKNLCIDNRSEELVQGMSLCLDEVIRCRELVEGYLKIF